MAPSSHTSRSANMGENRTRMGEESAKRETTPIPANVQNQGKAVKSDADLATVFKSDLTTIRNMVTCSICDQLLYEPWTLACGHTYCYSCLCNWFVPNKKKKTCPDCRSSVKLVPAPAFLVKQMVEVLIKRSELMPSDESIEQHTKKRLEEIAHVDRDRNGPDGLFKGTFPAGPNELWFDEADGVLRCPACGHEHEGGPVCEICGIDLDDEDVHGFSDGDMGDFDDTDDTDDDSLDGMRNLEFDLDAEDDDGEPRILPPLRFAYPHINFHGRSPSESEMAHRFDHGNLDSDEDDSGSMQDFIVDDERGRPSGGLSNDETNRREPITISDDDSEDEGGAISNRRQRRATWRSGRVVELSPSVLSVTDDGTNGSEAGDMNSEAEMLRHAGWSPLDQGNESDVDGQRGYEYNGFAVAIEDEVEDDESSAETMVGNSLSDDEDDDQSGSDRSTTPRYTGAGNVIPRNYASDGDEADDDESEVDLTTDLDGDTEMSVSPRASRSMSRSVDGYGSDVDGGTDVSGSSVSGVDSNRGEYLGGVTHIHEIEDDDSDGSIRPRPGRRHARRYHPNQRIHQQYDPRISMMFAEHQQSLRGALERSSEASNDLRRLEPASRTRRVAAGYRLPARRADPRRSSRSPSVTVVIASSSGRAPRAQRRDGRRE